MNRAIETRRRKVKNLLFDLDDTLYPKDNGLFKEVGKRIRLYMKNLLGISLEEADNITSKYRDMYGSSLMGFVYIDKIDPVAYRDFVYDIDYEKYLSPSKQLTDLFGSLVGYKNIIYTNGSRSHADRVLKALGIEDFFEMIVPVEDIYFYAKPTFQSFREMLRITGAHPSESILFDDQIKNLRTARYFGAGTVFIGSQTDEADLCVNDILELSPL